MFLRKGLLAAVAVVATAAWGAAPQAKNVIIVTADGLRWQEVFRGIDPLLMNEKTAGMAEAGALRKRLWRETPEARRAALMPFFWSTLVPKGVLLGNPDKNSSIKVTNAYRVSYPGYSEKYLKAAHPRVLHIAVGETDDWAHERHYDHVLDMISEFDHYLRELWEFMESSPEYRGNTVLVLTCDHGRGSTLEDWDSHGEKVPEAARIWAAFFGPGVPGTGEAANTPAAFQRDIAPTVLELLRIDYTEYKGVKGKPIGFVHPDGK